MGLLPKGQLGCTNRCRVDRVALQGMFYFFQGDGTVIQRARDYPGPNWWYEVGASTGHPRLPHAIGLWVPGQTHGLSDRVGSEHSKDSTVSHAELDSTNPADEVVTRQLA